MRIGVLTAILAASSLPATAQEEAQLAQFEGVSAIIATSAHPGISETRLRTLVEQRLQNRGLWLPGEGAAGARVDLQISGDHSTGSGTCVHTAYDVRMTVMEPATLSRSPGTTVFATTWQGGMRVSVFSKQLAAESVMDKVNDLLSSFAQAVTSSRQGAGARGH